jgi:putative oxidoreductase
VFNSFRAEWQPRILSVMRIVVSLLYLQYGLMKVFGFPVPGPASLSPLIMLAAAIETIGSLLLLIGLFTEAAAFIMSGEMAVAYLLRYVKNVYPIASQGGSLTVLFCFVFLYLIFAGGGSWSLDSARKRRLKS